MWFSPSARRFQSTLPAWGETSRPITAAMSARISIHSPRMGRDVVAAVPHDAAHRFQSTLPAWGETVRVRGHDQHGDISIHSPRMGRDEMANTLTDEMIIFQSTLPAWGETANAHNFSKRKTGASAQHCIFSPAKRFFLLTKNFLEKRNKPFFRCEPYSKTVGAPVSHQPLKN